MLMDISKTIFKEYQTRKTKKQKNAFIELYSKHLDEKQIPYIVQQGGKIGSKNIIVGSVEDAQIICTAHYDTAPALPFPNFIMPRNAFLQISLIVLLSFTIGIISSFSSFFWQYSIYIVNFIIFLFVIVVFFGKANKHTANDNTSGVITLTESILKAYDTKPNSLNKVAFVLFDNEEIGLFGSALFAKEYKKILDNKLIINFDCVSDGNHILVMENKKVAKNLVFHKLIEQCFNTENCKDPESCKKIHFFASGCFYPSDQIHFKNGVAIAACNKAKFIGFYINRIHTKRDIIFDELNIEILSNSILNIYKYV